MYRICTEDKPRVVEEDKDARARRMEKKRKLKAMFDADYDDVDGSGGSKHYDELKKEVDQQTMVGSPSLPKTTYFYSHVQSLLS